MYLVEQLKLKAEEKEVWIGKISGFSSKIKESGYAKRMPPTLKQIKNYLKGEFKVSKSDLETINEDNVGQKFVQLTTAVAPINIKREI